MSEEKLYVVKNDEGKYWDAGMPPWWDDKTGTVLKRIDLAIAWAKKYDGHVVTLIEEPEKVVLTEKQAKIVEEAHEAIWPATCISGLDSEQGLLMEAYVNGYTVAKEKKWFVKVPKTHDNWYAEECNILTTTVDRQGYAGCQFTQERIDHFGLNEYKKVEVTDDGTK